MNTAQLECFVSLAGTLNFMRTAEELHLSQPAVSKQIRSLESELGAQLFSRTTRSVTLTQVGERFLADAEDMLRISYHSMEWISSFQSRLQQVIRIGYGDPHCSAKISEVLTPILAEHPDLSPRLVMDQTDSNLNRLQHGQLDLIIGMRDATFAGGDITFRRLFDDTFTCVMRKDHPLAKALSEKTAREGGISTKDVWDCRQVLSIPSYLLKGFFSRGERIIPVNNALDNLILANANEAYSMVLAGFGYAMLPGHLLMPHPDLVFFPWPESPSCPFGIYYRQEGARQAPVIRAFLESAARVYRKA